VNPTGPFEFRVIHRDPGTKARGSRFITPHGPVELPAFMPVGTVGTVKGLTAAMVKETGASMVLANTYHLALRPGEQIVQGLGGLHAFMGWSGPILTDSGGFQLHSLAVRTSITDAGAVFRSHIDGRLFELSPERAVEIQESLGSDVAMVLDDVVGLPAPAERVEQAVARTVLWAERSRRAARRTDQALFAIVQGGLDLELRARCSEALLKLDFPGYALGGLSVGESAEDMRRIVALAAPLLPDDRPRYLMGVGKPADLLAAVAAGIDLFDCVLPTRNGRNAVAFTAEGPLRLKNLKHQLDTRPLEDQCPCPACRHSRGYLRHLFMAGEMLGPVLLSAHNLTYYQRLLAGARQAIAEGTYAAFRTAVEHDWRSKRDEE
jgi:queuine tRNA-ribosyltransferase